VSLAAVAIANTHALSPSYHQGPEWGHLGGYFLRALLHFEGKASKDVDFTLHSIYSMLAGRREHIRKDIWAGLPELVRELGRFGDTLTARRQTKMGNSVAIR
jgi:hypothetical protein